ncbi:MAG: hypothetical protein HRF49_04615 [bacterium]|jgi:MFS superfamily sulfate permease-like transporter
MYMVRENRGGLSCLIVRGSISGSQGQALVTKVLDCARTGVQAVVINLDECEAITTDLFSAFSTIRRELSRRNVEVYLDRVTGANRTIYERFPDLFDVPLAPEEISETEG